LSLLSDERRRLLARRLQEKGLGATSLTGLPRRDRSRPARLSFAQQRLWILDQLAPGDPFYNIGAVVEVRGALDPAVLARCFAEIVRRHEALRTTFVMAEGEPVQEIAAMPAHPADLWPLPEADLSALPEPAAEAEAVRLAREEAGRPFDLASGCLLRTVLLRRGPGLAWLLQAQHHIASDGWSNLVFLREMAALYEAFDSGRPSPLPELPVQYADFAEWQREELRGDRLGAELAFWRRALNGAPEALELPLDRPRPPVQTYRGTHRPVWVGPELSAGVRKLAKEAGATPFMVLLAAFGALLRRITGQDDLLAGTPVANRRRRELEGLVGFFVNTLVLRVEVAGDPPFRELLGRVRETAQDAYAHQDLPFERLIEELRPERDPSRPVLFQAMFSLDEAPAAEIDLPGTGLRLRLVDLPSGVAKLDLTLSLVERAGGFSGAVEINTDLFDPATGARWGEHYLTLLAGAVGDPGLELSALPLLTAAEQQQILWEWNDTASAAVPDGTVLDLIEERVRQAPEALAIDGNGGAVSYQDLWTRAGDLAGRLRDQGVGTESRVGIRLRRSPEALVAILGVLRAGGAFVPLDPDEPEERMAFLIEDSGVVLVVDNAEPQSPSPLGGGGWDRGEVRRGAAAWTKTLGLEIAPAPLLSSPLLQPSPSQGGGTLRPAVEGHPDHPDHAAYILYTSGSTGRPKGAVISHRALLTYALAATEQFNLRSTDRFLQFAPLTFDVAVEEIFPAWIRGGAVILEEPARLASVADLGRALADWNVTVAELPTAFWREWQGHLLRTGERPPACLRLTVIGGEKAAAESIALWRSWGVPLANAYGLTETTVTTIVLSDPPGSSVPRPEFAIGRPLADSWVGVLDSTLRPVPVGTVGEIFIGGAAVARGYLGRPALTAERFVPAPWVEEPGGRLYRTGDLARWLWDGNLEFLGRIDHQVKVRGFRVEIGEVEAALAEHPGVGGVAVVAREVQGTRQLVAYVAGPGLDAAALRERLRARLPEYMVPAFFVLLEALPLTPRGKIDRRALPAPEAGASRRGPAPRTPVEQTLAALWADALGLDSAPGVEDDFFELGGHSLLATRVVSRIRTAFGVELPLRALFERSTLAGLAGQIEEALHNGSLPAAAPLLPLGTGTGPPVRPGELRRAPLSFAQQRLWFLDRLDPGSAAYNLPVAVRLRGALSPAALAGALAGLVRRHEVLRTTYLLEEEAAEPVQVVALAAEPAPLPLVDLAGLPIGEREAEARRRVEEEAGRPFDLENGPVLRALLIRLAPEEHLLAATLHHIAGDGISLEILIGEVGLLYQGEVLEALPVQYPDFAVWQRGHLRGETLEAQLRFWRGELAGVPAVLELPADRPGGESLEGAQRRFDLPPELAAGLRALARQQGATLFMTLLAGFEALLQRVTGQDRFAVGTPIAGRRHAEVEGLIGFFVNTLALRADLAAQEPEGIRFDRLLERVRRTALAAYSHPDLPFERLVEELRSGEDRAARIAAGAQPLFQVVFALENAPAGPPQSPGLTLEPLATHSGTAKWDLLLSAVDTGGRLAVTWEYRAGRFDPSTIDRLTGHLSQLLTGAMSAPVTPVAELPLLSEEEREQLRDWSRNDAPFPREATIHGLFAEQARRTPEAIALEDREERLTYAELAARARRLAGRLTAAGLGPERTAALLVDRSPDAIVALLAIMEAGGAYLPLDPSHPAERLRWIVGDARPAVLVADRKLLEEHPWAAEAGIPVVVLGEEGSETRDERPTVDPAGLAYVMYTSGSTGTPKGVAVTHRNVIRLVRLVRGADYVELGPGETFLQLAPLAFDASTLEIWGPLLNGGRLVLFPERRAGLDDLAAAIRRAGVTALWLTAGLFHTMVEHRLEGLRPLRQLLAGGDVLSPVHVRRALEGLPGTVLVNGYGPTEGTTFTCCHRVTALEPGAATVPIGRPIPNARVHVVDRAFRPVPAGVAGELLAGGEGLARGYFGQPDRTAERFVPDPFGPSGSRLYRTGDRARWRPDGALEFLGRLDNQVKVRGFRIEPGEIEAVLAGHPGVRQTAVVAIRDASGGQALVAFVVPKKKAAAEGGALPEVPYVAPSTPLEEAVVEVVAEMLGLDRRRLSLRHNFFDLGGHSLLATQVAVVLRDRVGVEIPLLDFFETADLGALADRILDRELNGAGDLDGLLDEMDLAVSAADQSGEEG
jgi:amino acid adenylation domain-containing protein